MLGQLLETLSGHWAVHLESRVPRTELYEARIASSKPSLGFFHSSDQLCSDRQPRADLQQHGGCDLFCQLLIHCKHRTETELSGSKQKQF